MITCPDVADQINCLALAHHHDLRCRLELHIQLVAELHFVRCTLPVIAPSSLLLLLIVPPVLHLRLIVVCIRVRYLVGPLLSRSSCYASDQQLIIVDSLVAGILIVVEGLVASLQSADRMIAPIVIRISICFFRKVGHSSSLLSELHTQLS